MKDEERKRTVAKVRFDEVIARTHFLLESGIAGVDTQVEKLEEIILKFGDLRGTPGPTPKDYEPTVEAKRRTDGNVTVTMDDRTAWDLQRTLTEQKSRMRKARFHLYSVLLVYAWAAFETYVIMMLEEVFEKQPNLLKSREVITFEEVVDAQEDILAFARNKQLEKVGHFGLLEIFDYLESRLNFTFPSRRQDHLRRLYLVRNVVAHHTGIVRPSSKERLPSQLSTTSKGELRITKRYLERAIRILTSSVRALERHVQSKFH